MQTTAALSSLRTRAAALAAAAAVAGSFAFAGAADAKPIKNTGSKGCPVEHEDGRVTYVPVGTQVGLFKCGSDGEWHFGWLVDHLVAGDGGTAGGPVVNGTLTPVAAR